MEVEEVKKQLLEWISKFKHIDKTYNEDFCIKEDKGKVKLTLYTDKNIYYIHAYPPKDEDRGYLGAIYSCRKPRAGESWTRGGDLTDGDFNHETWVKILGDIIGTELIKIVNKEK